MRFLKKIYYSLKEHFKYARHEFDSRNNFHHLPDIYVELRMSPRAVGTFVEDGSGVLRVLNRDMYNYYTFHPDDVVTFEHVYSLIIHDHTVPYGAKIGSIHMLDGQWIINGSRLLELDFLPESRTEFNNALNLVGIRNPYLYDLLSYDLLKLDNQPIQKEQSC